MVIGDEVQDSHSDVTSIDRPHVIGPTYRLTSMVPDDELDAIERASRFRPEMPFEPRV
jgi:hypothetical protein